MPKRSRSRRTRSRKSKRITKRKRTRSKRKTRSKKSRSREKSRKNITRSQFQWAIRQMGPYPENPTVEDRKMLKQALNYLSQVKPKRCTRKKLDNSVNMWGTINQSQEKEIIDYMQPLIRAIARGDVKWLKTGRLGYFQFFLYKKYIDYNWNKFRNDKDYKVPLPKEASSKDAPIGFGKKNYYKYLEDANTAWYRMPDRYRQAWIYLVRKINYQAKERQEWDKVEKQMKK